MEGYIKLYRELIKKPIWLNSTPEQKTILITLLLMANHNSNSWEWNCEKFIVSPGQFITSVDSIKKNCGKGVSEQNIKTSLKRFQKLEFLTNKSTKMGRIITIINWSSYQPDNKKLTNELTIGSPTTNQRLTTNKNERMKECKEINIYSSDFLKFWGAYPKKIGKGSAFISYQKIKTPKPQLEIIIGAIEIQNKSKQWQDAQFIPNPSTWLNQRRWEDELKENTEWNF